MEAKYFDSAHQRLQAPGAKQLGTVSGKRRGDHLQIGEQLIWRRISRQVAMGGTGRRVMREITRCRSKPCIHPDQRLSIRLVLAVDVGVMSELRQRHQICGRLD